MGRKPLSSDLRAVLIHMSHKRNLSVKEIEKLTSVKSRTIQKVLKWYNETGTIAPLKRPTIRGRKINNDYFEVCLALLEQLKLILIEFSIFVLTFNIHPIPI